MVRRSILMVFSLLLALFLAGCGMDSGGTTTTTTTGNATGSGSTTVAPTSTAMANDAMNATPTMTTSQQANATPTMTGNQQVNGSNNQQMNGSNGQQVNGSNGQQMNGDPNAFIHLATVMLNGKPVMVLTTNKGMVLYYRRNDPAPDSGCTGMCAKDWPPLLAPANMMTVTAAPMLPKQLSVHMTANGNQVEYDNHPLYTYAGDMSAGQFTGRGMDNVWYLVGINL